MKFILCNKQKTNNWKRKLGFPKIFRISKIEIYLLRKWGDDENETTKQKNI